MCLYVIACHLVRHNYSCETSIDYVQIPEVKLLYWLKTQFRDQDVR